jgi:cytochrome o ubiquinol oxidase operon protein cyoD
MKSTSQKYLTGFVLSIILTVIAYDFGVSSILNSNATVFLILVLAVVQALVQLIFFLHLGQEKKPQWNLFLVLSTVGLIIIIMTGSLWIIHNLNYNHMSEADMQNYMLQNQGF